MIEKKIKKMDIDVTKEMKKNSITTAHMIMYDVMISMKQTLLEMVKNASEEELADHAHRYLEMKTIPYPLNDAYNMKTHKAFVLSYIMSESGVAVLE